MWVPEVLLVLATPLDCPQDGCPPVPEVAQDFILVPGSPPGAPRGAVTASVGRDWRGQMDSAQITCPPAHLGKLGQKGTVSQVVPVQADLGAGATCCLLWVMRSVLVSVALRTSFFLCKTKDTRNRLTQKRSKISTTAGRRQKQRRRRSACLCR